MTWADFGYFLLLAFGCFVGVAVSIIARLVWLEADDNRRQARRIHQRAETARAEVRKRIEGRK